MGKAKTSAAFAAISGSFGDTVVARGRGGLSTRGKSRYKYPKNAAVQAGNARLSAGNVVWNSLTWQQADAWNRYAATLTHHDGLTGQPYHPTGKNVLVGLAAKLLQIDSHATIPLTPPTGAFMPPSVVVTVAGGAGLASFTASAPTPLGYVAELLVQPLLNERRSPTRFYKSQAFVPFVAGSLTRTVALPPGWHAAAVRFVEASTGRTGLTMPLGKFQVA